MYGCFPLHRMQAIYIQMLSESLQTAPYQYQTCTILRKFNMENMQRQPILYYYPSEKDWFCRQEKWCFPYFVLSTDLERNYVVLSCWSAVGLLACHDISNPIPLPSWKILIEIIENSVFKPVACYNKNITTAIFVVIYFYHCLLRFKLSHWEVSREFVSKIGGNGCL